MKLNNHNLFTSIVETWRPVVDFEESYEVSSFGNIRSVDRIVPGSRQSLRFRKGKLMKPKLSKTGYIIIGLCKDAKKSHPSIHRLVAKAFIKKVEGKDTVNHKDGDKQNNNVSNLEWSTSGEQMLHAFSTGLCKPRGNEVYSPAFKLRVRAYYEETGCSIKKLAEVFQISDRSAGRFTKFTERGKFTIPEEKIEHIKQMRKDGMTLEKISKIIGCGISQIHRITKGLSRNVQHERN